MCFISLGTFTTRCIFRLHQILTDWSEENVKVAQSCPTLWEPRDCSSQWNSLDWNTGVGSLSLLQGIFPTQGWNPGHLHCRQILYQLSHKGSPRILEWLAYPFCSGSSWPRNWTRVSYIAGRFFTNWAIREARFTNSLTGDDLLFMQTITCLL